MKNIYQYYSKLTLAFFMFVSLSMSGTALAESSCKGMSKGQCSGDSSCVWVKGYTKKDGEKVKGYCRTKGKKGEKGKKDKDSKKDKKSKNDKKSKKDKKTKSDKKSKKDKKSKSDKKSKEDKKSE